LLIIILVQRLSKKYSIITCCTYLFFAGILQGYSNREESTRNKEHFGMQKEGRIIKEDNQQGGKVRSTCRPWLIFVVNYYFGAMSF